MHYCVPPVVNMQELQNHPCLTSFKKIHSSVAKSCHSCNFFLILHSHKDCPLVDKKLHSREVPKHHIDDKEEEGSTPVEAIERTLWLSIYHM